MGYEKAVNISYMDLKEACRIFNRHKHMLGTKIKIRKQGFAYLMEAFINAMRSVPADLRINIPDEVNAFYQALPAECFETLNIAAPERLDYSSDSISEFKEVEETSAMRDAGPIQASHSGCKHKQVLFYLPEGKIRVKTNTGLMNVIRHLENLVAAFKEKNLCLASGNRVIVMKPDTIIGINLEAVNDEDKHTHREKLTIKFQWVRKIAMDRNSNNYSISSNLHHWDRE